MKISRILDPTSDWNSTDPDTRWQALTSRLPPQDMLVHLARTDADVKVRAFAAGHLDDVELVASLANDPDEMVAASAMQRWVTLAVDQQSVESGLAALSRISSEILLTSIARFADHVEVRIESVNRINSDPLLSRILDAENHALVHQACAARLSDEANIEGHFNRFRGKDKVVARTLRQKLADIRAARERELMFSQQCQRLCESFELLARNVHGDLFNRRYALFDEAWREITMTRNADVDQDVRNRIESARARCRRVRDSLPLLKKEQESAAESVVAALDALTAECMVAIPEDLGAILEGLRKDWPIGLGEDHPLAHRYYESISALDALAAQFRLCMALPRNDTTLAQLKGKLERISWPEAWPVPTILQDARVRLAAMEQEDEKQKARKAQEAAQLTSQLVRLEQTIGEGKLKPANKLHNTIRKRIDHADRHHKDHFAKLSQQLHELQDWQGFVTMPKRLELCEAMEALRDNASVPPSEKARAIKDLQEQWKVLGPSNTRQGQQFWTRFKSAADVAFEPCAAYFAEQMEARDRNLAERENICSVLESLLAGQDWEDPDWKVVNDTIIKAKRDWRQYEDVPHAKRKKIQGRFSRVLRKLEAKLGEEHERNHQKKRDLVARIQSLLATEGADVATLIKEAKRAQSEWKEIGITERKTDQQLWKAFRAECDKVFAVRDTESQREKQAQRTAQDAATGIKEKLKKMAEKGDIDPARLKRITAEFAEVAPPREAGAVHKEFKRQVKLAEKAIEKQAALSQRQMVDEVRRKAEICSRLEQGAIDASQADGEWHSEVELPSSISLRLDERRSAAGSTDETSLAHNLEAAERLCVRMEIMAELPSPPHAQQLRMRCQVERLNRELSQGIKETRTPDEQVRDLLVDWYCLGALPNGSDELRLRFARAEERLTAT